MESGFGYLIFIGMAAVFGTAYLFGYMHGEVSGWKDCHEHIAKPWRKLYERIRKSHAELLDTVRKHLEARGYHPVDPDDWWKTPGGRPPGWQDDRETFEP